MVIAIMFCRRFIGGFGVQASMGGVLNGPKLGQDKHGFMGG